MKLLKRFKNLLESTSPKIRTREEILSKYLKLDILISIQKDTVFENIERIYIDTTRIK